MAVTAWLGAGLASAALSWPVTADRVNAPFIVLWLVGGWLAVLWLGDRMPERWRTPVLALAVVALVALNLPDSSNHEGPKAWARGLDAQLAPIRASTAPEIVVLGYHWMVEPYLHDGLVNRRPDGGRYRIVSERYDGQFADVDATTLVAPFGLRPGDEVWCVIAVGVAVGEAQRACVLPAQQYEQLTHTVGTRGIVIGYRVRA